MKRFTFFALGAFLMCAGRIYFKSEASRAVPLLLPAITDIAPRSIAQGARGEGESATDSFATANVDEARYINLMDMKRSGPLLTRLRFVDDTGCLSGTFRKVFEVENLEFDRLSQIVARVRAQVGELQIEHAKVTRDYNTIEFTVETFPAEGGRLYDEMMASCSSILGGGSRGEAFSVLCGEQIERAFGGAMGCDRIRGMISRTGTDSWTVMVSNHGDAGPGMDEMYRFDSFAEMQSKLGPLAQLVSR